MRRLPLANDMLSWVLFFFVFFFFVAHHRARRVRVASVQELIFKDRVVKNLCCVDCLVVTRNCTPHPGTSLLFVMHQLNNEKGVGFIF